MVQIRAEAFEKATVNPFLSVGLPSFRTRFHL